VAFVQFRTKARLLLDVRGMARWRQLLDVRDVSRSIYIIALK
jgi:hypothetical protein